MFVGSVIDGHIVSMIEDSLEEWYRPRCLMREMGVMVLVIALRVDG